MFAGESALASGYYIQHIEEVCNTIIRVITKFDFLLENGKWERDPEFQGEHFTISEGFFLIWADPKSGDVPGRLASGEDHTFLIAAYFLDLLSHGFIHLVPDEETKKISPLSIVALTEKAAEKPGSGRSIGNHLDYLLERIRISKPKTLKRWISKLYGERSYFKAVVDELVKKGVIEETKKNFLFFSRKYYPTIKREAEEALKNNLRSLLLQHHSSQVQPGLAENEDPRLVALLALCRLADCYDLNEHFLPHIFSKEELDREHAIMRLKELVDDTICHSRVKENVGSQRKLE